MALCSECTARIEYQGNGSQKDYVFPFEYYDISEIQVSVYNPETKSYDSLIYQRDWILVNPTTIRLDTPTPNEIVIYRCTDISLMRATFTAGTPIKAAELNDDFDQLRNAIEEGRCNAGDLQEQVTAGKDIFLNRVDSDLKWEGRPGDLVKSNSDLTIDDEHVATTQWIDNRYWDQCEETTTINTKWNDDIDDSHIPTTGAVEQRLTSLNAVQGLDKVTGQMQSSGQWNESVTNDAYLATTSALVQRHDVYLSSVNIEYPDSVYAQPGKIWIKEDTAELYYRRSGGYQWVQLDTKGEKGDPGADGTAATVTVGTTATGEPGTDAIVTNVGTENAAILNFTIPRGLPGGSGGGDIADIIAGNGIEIDKTIPDIPKISVKFGVTADATTTVMPFNMQLLSSLP